MLSSNIHRHRESRDLPRDAGNVHDALGVAGADFARLRGGCGIQPARDGDLSRADRVREVDVQAGVVADSVRAVQGVFGLRRAWRVPEIGPVGLEDAGAGTDLRVTMLEVVESMCEVRKLCLAQVILQYPHRRTLSRQHRTCSSIGPSQRHSS